MSDDLVARLAKAMRAVHYCFHGDKPSGFILANDVDADALARAVEPIVRSRVSVLEAALRPFAKEAEQWQSDHSDSTRVLTDGSPKCGSCGEHSGISESEFTVGDLRRARTALSGTERADAVGNDAVEPIAVNLPFARVPMCACDPGHGDPPSKAKRLACKIGGGPCSGSADGSEREGK